MAVILVKLNSYGLSGSRAQFSIDPISLKNQMNGGSERAFGRLNRATNALFFESPADAPTDGSIVLMPVFASDLGISPTNPRFSYSVIAFDGSGSAGDAVAGTGYFNAFAPAVSNAMFVSGAPNTTMDVPVAIDRVEFTNTPAIGFMVVTQDNRSGGSEAALLPLDD